ncbi:hypothetical protein [Limisphaera sp. VF-2]|jgi:hypothetical protein
MIAAGWPGAFGTPTPGMQEVLERFLAPGLVALRVAIEGREVRTQFRRE